MKVTVTDIKWDAPRSEKKELPKTLVIDIPDDIQEEGNDTIIDYVSYQISNETGFCHFGFATDLDDNF